MSSLSNSELGSGGLLSLPDLLGFGGDFGFLGSFGSGGDFSSPDLLVSGDFLGSSDLLFLGVEFFPLLYYNTWQGSIAQLG